MKTDWRDALGALAGTLPEGEPDNTDAQSSDSAENADSFVDPGRLRVTLERKGRNGKTATIISGFDSLTDDRLRKIASDLKQALGTGGSARGGEILIQGDRVSDVRRYFKMK